jgi:hypothetical protein
MCDKLSLLESVQQIRTYLRRPENNRDTRRKCPAVVELKVNVSLPSATA